MEYLLVMSLSGTTSACICILLGYLMKGRISAEMQYLLLKISILYYLIPLPFLKKQYQDILVHLTGFRFIKDGDINILGHRSYRMARVNGSVYINDYLKIHMAVAAVWMLAAIFILLVELYHYIKTRKYVVSCIHHVNMKQEVIDVERRIGPCRLTQKVMVYYVFHTAAVGCNQTKKNHPVRRCTCYNALIRYLCTNPSGTKFPCKHSYERMIL